MGEKSSRRNPQVSLSIIIVNWNSGEQLRECLESIVSATVDGFTLDKVIVVDNASSDGSAKNISDIKLPLQVLYNKENLGFAAACNMGAKQTSSDYLLFLNPDTKLFQDSLSTPILFLEQQDKERIGILGVQLVDENGHVSRTCARFPTPCTYFSQMLGLNRLFPNLFPSHFMTEWDHGTSRIVDHVIGAFFLVRTSIFQEIGGFDERYFVYLEDLDFSLRTKYLGYVSYYLATTQIYHKGGGSSEQIKATRLFYSLQSRLVYSYKHFGFLSATSVMLGTVLLEPLSRLVWALIRWEPRTMKETIEGYLLLWRSIPKILRTKRG